MKIRQETFETFGTKIPVFLFQEKKLNAPMKNSKLFLMNILTDCMQ